MIYNNTITPIVGIYKGGRTTNPNTCPTGVNGKTIVMPTIDRLANKRYFLGRLFLENNGFLVLMTSTTIDADITDSVNHAARNLEKIIKQPTTNR
jgi:hypothetical protein